MSQIRNLITDILNDKNISISEFCNIAKINKNAIYELDNRYPTLTNALKIADTLDVSLDYLLGISFDENINYDKDYKINFYENLDKFLKNKNISKRKFCNDLKLSKDAFTRWKKGAIPYVSTLLEISKYLNCSIDELIGRL